jgi:hypothetical protein
LLSFLLLLQMLLGMYRCTDIPGKFVWQPGTLTQAVSKGHWILLEDIDHAPLDVVGICTPESHMELHEVACAVIAVGVGSSLQGIF